MQFQFNDGGRQAAGFKGTAGDCVCRAIAIAAELPYTDVYKALANGTGQQRASRGKKRSASARAGINTSRKWFKDYMTSLGFAWTPTMHIGSGCQVHLTAEELPAGRIIVAVSKHYAAVVDGVLHDTYDHSHKRVEIGCEDGVDYRREYYRCVYGYWSRA